MRTDRLHQLREGLGISSTHVVRGVVHVDEALHAVLLQFVEQADDVVFAGKLIVDPCLRGRLDVRKMERWRNARRIDAHGEIRIAINTEHATVDT